MSRYNYTSCNYGASACTTLEKLGLLLNSDNIAAQKTPQIPPSLTLHSRNVWDTLAEVTDKVCACFGNRNFYPFN